MKKSTYIIAEAGVNHNGNLKLAKELISKAKECGADCVKFQTFKAKNLVNEDSPKAEYQKKVTDPKESQLAMLSQLELGERDFKLLYEFAKEIKIDFISTPYSYEDAVMLNNIGVEAFKISSAQLIEHQLLLDIGKLGKTMILSTGMANLSEVFDSVEILKNINSDIVVLQCTTNYPSKIEDSNILAMRNISRACGVRVGYSDHVPNNYACYAAVALGAEVIEKHFTLDKNLPGPDHSSSLDPDDFKTLVYGIRQIEMSLGSEIKKPSEAEIANTSGMRRGIKAAVDIKKGQIITKSMIEFKRPLIGLKPNQADSLIGSKALLDIPKYKAIYASDIQWKLES